jgi:hypothetical protein
MTTDDELVAKASLLYMTNAEVYHAINTARQIVHRSVVINTARQVVSTMVNPTDFNGMQEMLVAALAQVLLAELKQRPTTHEFVPSKAGWHRAGGCGHLFTAADGFRSGCGLPASDPMHG